MIFPIKKKGQYDLLIEKIVCTSNNEIFHNVSCSLNASNKTSQSFTMESQLQPGLIIDNVMVLLFFIAHLQIKLIHSYFR